MIATSCRRRDEGIDRVPVPECIEGGFFGDNHAFRLRHGFGEYGRQLGGQSWRARRMHGRTISEAGLLGEADAEGPVPRITDG